ncbi:MAG: tannase/feruloyl esterase family alpha/beta hydrolase, partial [Burkholderiaceae bacterium]
MKTIVKTVLAGSVSVALAGCAFLGKKEPLAGVDCQQIATHFVANGVRITGAESVPAGLTVSGMAQPYAMPAHCKVMGKMNERTGIDGKPYAIGFEMRLPVNWSGRFLLQANGGSDGVVVPAFGNVVSGGATTNALMQGFAVLSSDAGHTAESGAAVGLVGGNVFGLDPQARLDYGYQAHGALAPMARQLIATHYGQPPKRSYMMGCSNGGRQAMVAAARYADQFDGVIAG